MDKMDKMTKTINKSIHLGKCLLCVFVNTNKVHLGYIIIVCEMGQFSV